MNEKVIDILNEIRPEFDFSQDVNFLDKCMLDSFDIVNLVCALEKEFNICIDGLDIIPENFANIQSILNLLTKTKQNYESNFSQ